MRHVVIMAGGSGTRFWPRSRERMPKQLIHIIGKGTMLQETARRLWRFVPPTATLVVTTQAQVEETRRQLPELAPERVVGEPMGRDTAACIGLAAALVAREDPDGVMVVAPADQLIHPAEKLAAALEAACDVAERTGRIVTFGIKPTSPSVVYGYVQRGERLFEARQRPVYAVARFHEKPKREAAEEFLRRGDCYWNSGMFVWSVSTILAAIQRYRPALHGAIARISAALGTPKAENIIADEYSKLEKISIDYAVLEKADNVVIIEADFEWDDVGSWLALERHCKPDGDGNVVAGTHVGVDTRRCILAGEPGHVIATIGLSDAIVIHTPDATLVCNKAQAPEIKTLVAQLKAKGLEKHL